MKDRPDLHCQLDAPARPACTVPAKVLAAHNYCKAAADHNLPPLTATFASLPPRTPCGAYPADSDVEATFNEAEVDRHLRAIRACATAGIEGLRNQQGRALAIGEDDDEQPRQTRAGPHRGVQRPAERRRCPGRVVVNAGRSAAQAGQRPGDALVLAACVTTTAALQGPGGRTRGAPRGFFQTPRLTPPVIARLRATHGLPATHAAPAPTLEDAAADRGTLVVVFVDVANAFSTVSHDVLLRTLTAYGVPHRIT